MKSLYAIALFLTAFSVKATNWYVAPNGINSLTSNRGKSKEEPFKTIQYGLGQCEPGDNLYIMNGTYHNPGFGSGNLNNGPLCYINKSGSSGKYITIRNHPGHKPKLEFDGSGGFIAGADVTWVRIIGLTIQGPNAKINLEKALEYRLEKPNYYNGAGIAFWGPSHHIQVRNCTVYDCPNSAIRANKSDYVTFNDNVVYNSSWYSSSGSSALVIAESKDIDQSTKYKMIIRRNTAYNNKNLVPIYIRGQKNGEYAGPDYDKIVDGRGIYMTRNPDYIHGKYYIADNICYNNGFGGLTFHISNNGTIVNNTLYKNGTTNGGREGMTITKAHNVDIYNNIIWARGIWAVYNYTAPGPSTNVTFHDNLIYNGKSSFSGENNMFDTNPQFVNPDNNNFRLKSNSPAINKNTKGSTLSKDLVARPQRGTFDLGAFEYNTIPFNKTIWLQTKAKDNFVSADEVANRDFPPLTSRSTSVGDNEKFLLKKTGAYVYLKSIGNDKLVTVRTQENSQILRAMAPKLTNAERFTIYQDVNGAFTFKSRANNKYVTFDSDNVGRLTASSTAGSAQQFIYNPNVASFTSDPAPLVNIDLGNNTTYWIKNKASSKYIHSNGDQDESNSVVHNFDETWWSQKWVTEKVNENTYRFRCKWGDNYLTNEGGNVEVSASLDASSGKQDWILEEVSSNVYRLTNKADNKNLNASNSWAGSNVDVIAQNASSENQQWEIVLDDSGYRIGADVRESSEDQIVFLPNRIIEAQLTLSNTATIAIYNMKGVLMDKQLVTKEHNTFVLKENINSGTYIFRITTTKNTYAVKSFFK